MAEAPRAVVRNAADPKQVAFGRRLERRRRERLIAVLRSVMQTEEGREVLAALVEGCKVFDAVYDHSGSTMYFNEGRRNVGLEWLALMVEADEKFYELLERERRLRRRLEDSEIDAVHTGRAATEEDESHE
jgi:hypothetical protein